MNLKDWNKLQVKCFEEFKLRDITDIYIVASSISYYRGYELNEHLAKELIIEIENILKRSAI